LKTRRDETQPCPPETRLAFFDFDGTLTTQDTLWPFASFLSDGRGLWGATRTGVYSAFLQLKLRLRSNHSFKKHLLPLLVQDESQARIELLTQQFHDTNVEPMLNRDVLQALSRHTASGDHVYLVSSNFDFFLRPFAERWGLQGVIATQTEVREGKFTGRILGSTCHGKEKLARVLGCFDEARIRSAAAYGDSPSDAYLMNFVKTAHWVRSGKCMGELLSVTSA
jgi:phosphatidylglycerophosphatase C